jgi:hypothetical protein
MGRVIISTLYEGLASVHVEPKGAPEVVDVVLEALRPSG